MHHITPVRSLFSFAVNSRSCPQPVSNPLSAVRFAGHVTEMESHGRYPVASLRSRVARPRKRSMTSSVSIACSCLLLGGNPRRGCSSLSDFLLLIFFFFAIPEFDVHLDKFLSVSMVFSLR